MSPKKYDRLSGLIGILIGIVFCIASLHIGLGEVQQPGPGFLPFLAGATLVILSMTIFLPALTKKKTEFLTLLPKKSGRYNKIILLLLLLVFFNFVMNFLGFSVTTFIFVIFSMWLVEKQSLKRSFATAFFTSTGFYLIFKSWLMLDLPVGPWGF